MNSVKVGLLSLICVLLVLPLWQIRYQVVQEPKLFGIYENAGVPELKSFSWKAWFKGTFQDKIFTQVKDHTGFRNTLIRINNQADFSCFGLIHAEGFVAGKRGFLFEEDYIHEYTGKYFIGKNTLDRKIRRLKSVQEALAKRGTRLLFVIEPGKASFCPENIANCYHPERRTMTNDEYMKQRLDALHVDYIDLNQWFIGMKDTCRYKLFPEYGMHWSLYGVSLAVDSISSYLRGKYCLQVPEFHFDSIVISDSLRGSDHDIADMVNLLFPMPKVTAAYPVIRFDPKKPTLRVIGVADSYFNNIYYDYAPKLFANTEFWYYNSSLYYKDSYGDTKVDHSNLTEKFKNTDLILLMVSEINNHCGFWNFIDQAFVALYPSWRDDWSYKYENTIRNDRWWFRGMVKQAAEEGTTLERAIKRNADYTMCVDFDKLENKTKNDSITQIIWGIRTTPKWMHKVWSLAKERKEPLENTMRSEAEYALSLRN